MGGARRLLACRFGRDGWRAGCRFTTKAGLTAPSRRSLNNLGIQLSTLGQHGAAVEATREAVETCRSLAGEQPAAFLPDLALREPRP